MSDPPNMNSNVIHVAFGQDRGRVERDDRADKRVTSATVGRRSLDAGSSDPVAAVYSRAEVARIFALDAARLRTWERAGLVRPSADDGGARRYTFQDLIGVRTAKELIERGVPPARIRRAVEALRRSLPGTSPLAELRIVSDGTTLAVRHGDTTFDPVTGQMILDFRVGSVRDDVVRALPDRTARQSARTAYDFYLEGCRLDSDDSTFTKAEAAYRKAIALDPGLASAYTNLGTLRLMQGDRRDAEALFRRAISVDPSQSEAPYNLGFLQLELRNLSEAIELLARATELDPEFADAHFNLAVAMEEVGRDTDALPHWTAYLALEPEGAYAAVARERVREE